MREDFWSFDPTHKFWVSANHEPEVRGTDDGIWRRFRKLPFDVSFQGRANKDLKHKLRAELPGILAWAVRGCLDWQRAGLGEPKSVADATQRYREEQDTFGVTVR
jgi:putative DNA primase/helicase